MTVDPVFSRNPQEAERLAAKHVLVVGLGSVGSALALMFARAGVGRFTLVDPDIFALENVGRHMLSREHVGQAKVTAMERAIKAINPRADVQALAEDFTKLDGKALWNGRQADLLVGVTDSFACQSLLNGLSLAESVPGVYGGCWGDASTGEILYVVPGRTPCFECYAGFRRNTAPLPVGDRRKYTDPDFDETRILSQAGLWANILVVTGVMFQVVLGLLDPESDRAQLIDCEHTLFLVNVSDYAAHLQPLAVTFGKVKRGCAVCDEDKLGDLREGLEEELQRIL